MSLRRSRSLGMRGVALSASLLLLYCSLVQFPGRCAVRVATRPVDRSQSLEFDLPVAAPGGAKALTVGPAALLHAEFRPHGRVAAREHLRCRRLGRGAGSIGAAGGFRERVRRRLDLGHQQQPDHPAGHRTVYRRPNR